MKTIWIVNYYAMPPEYDVWGRHYEFAKELIKAGYNVRVFTSGYIYGYNIDLVPKGRRFVDTNYGEVPYTLMKVPPSPGNGFKRINSIYQFAYNLFKLRKRWEKPDVIYHNQRCPFDYPIVKLAKKINVRYIVETWDLWPYDFVRSGLINKRNPAIKVAYWLEQKMYDAASDIIFTFPGGVDYLNMRKLTISYPGGTINPKKVHYINNGINLSDFYENCKRYITEDEELNSDNKFKVVYLGSINLTNNVRQLIEAAELLQDDERFIFLIYGNGSEKRDLMRYVEHKGIKNVKFKTDRIPFHDCAYIVSKASLNVMNYNSNVGAFGVSTGKMFQYMAAGKPILCNVKINYSPLEEYQCGIDLKLDNARDYADAIRNFADMPKDEYNKMCNNAKTAAKHFDYGYLSKKLIKVIENK